MARLPDIKRRHRCPACQQSDGLWEEIMVSGWRELDEFLTPSTSNREVDWYEVEPTGNVGCSCGWGPKLAIHLEQIGLDGEPLPAIHREQMELGSGR